MDKLTAPSEIAWKLDEYQLAATEAPLGNTCVFAVAGSGKTTLLTHRVANLIYHGIPEYQILLVTFTNQAAKEMTERIHKVLDKDNVAITSGTFHSIANTFLKYFDGKRIQILDQDDALALFKKSYDSIVPIDIDEQFSKYLTYKKLFYFLSGSINHHEELIHHIVKTNGFNGYEKYSSIIHKVIDDYKEKKKESNLRDFDDLLVDVYNLLLNHPEARKKLTDKYQYIFVDEYQDVNWLQYNFLKLMNVNNNMFVVGDRAQCIYQFRGSKDEYMDTFETDYENVQTYFLKKNYRSRPGILKAAENTINFNQFKYNIELEPFKEPIPDDPSLNMFAAENQYDEANEIIWQIQRGFSHDEYEDIAILVRANYQTKLFEQELTSRGMPFRVVGVLGFYQRAHIKVLVALLTFMQNKKNQIAFSKIITLFPTIGEITGNNLYEALKNDYNFDFGLMMDDYSFKNKNQKFAMNLLRYIAEETQADEMISLFMENFYEDYLVSEYEDGFDRVEDANALIRQSEQFDLDDFLENINLYNTDENPEEDDEPKITLMTVHKAKGKEWKYVYLPSLVFDSFPMKASPDDYILNIDKIKAERNLFYVACTRAKEQLYMSYYEIAKINSSKGIYEIPQRVSPYVIEAIEHRKDM